MLNRRDDVAFQIGLEDRKQSVQSALGAIELYLGESADSLRELGLLNIIVRGETDTLSCIDIEQMESIGLSVENQESLHTLNASTVTGIWLDDIHVFAQHWDGYVSVFERNTMTLRSQRFTK